MVCSDHKRSSPQIRPPVLHCLDEGDEFMLGCHQLGVSLCHLTAEEGHWSRALMEHRVETVTRRIALHDEIPIKVGELQHRRRGERALQGPEHSLCVDGPGEAVLLEELGQRSCDVVIRRDEAPIVDHQTEKGTHRTHRALHRPVDHRLDLLLVHVDAVIRHHMAQIRHGAGSELALGSFHEQMVFLQLGKDKTDVAKVLGS
jgi:hypothetical protein